MNLLDMNLKAVFVKYIAIGSYNNKNNKLLECISNKLQAGVAKLQPGFVHVTRICSRTRDWPACVAPAKNNFICVFIAYNFSNLRLGRGALTVLYKRLSTLSRNP
jgi:hypothetical protein